MLKLKILALIMLKAWQVWWHSQLQRQTYLPVLCGASPSLHGHTRVQLAMSTSLNLWFSVARQKNTNFPLLLMMSNCWLEWCAVQTSFVAFSPANTHPEHSHRKRMNNYIAVIFLTQVETSFCLKTKQDNSQNHNNHTYCCQLSLV